MERRHLVGGGILASLTALASPAPAAAAAAAADSDAGVANAIDELRRTLERQAADPWRGIRQVREQQRSFLRASHKYPDYLEVGTQVWESVYDWHVTNQQPPGVERLPDGQYVMVFMFTTLLLRPDLEANYVGYPFDGDRTARRPAGA